jgi:hypothetical protein
MIRFLAPLGMTACEGDEMTIKRIVTQSRKGDNIWIVWSRQTMTYYKVVA